MFDYLSIETLGTIAVCCALAANVLYLHSLYCQTSKPHTITWLIWSIIMIVCYFGQASEGAGPGSWATGIGAVFGVIVFLYALRAGETGIGRFDWFCLALAMVGVGLLLVYPSPVYSILLLTLVDALGYLPTIRKSWINPRDEALLPWMLFTLSWIFAVAALETVNVATAVYPVTVGTGSAATVLVLSRRFLTSLQPS